MIHFRPLTRTVSENITRTIVIHDVTTLYDGLNWNAYRHMYFCSIWVDLGLKKKIGENFTGLKQMDRFNRQMVIVRN